MCSKNRSKCHYTEPDIDCLIFFWVPKISVDAKSFWNRSNQQLLQLSGELEKLSSFFGAFEVVQGLNEASNRTPGTFSTA